jgi:hypothetical protein
LDIFHPRSSAFLCIITIYSSNNLTGISFATCYGTYNCRCTVEGSLKVLGYGSKESSWKKKRTFNSFRGAVFLHYSWVFPKTSGNVYPSGSENT